MSKHCFDTCVDEACHSGHPCKRIKRRVKAGEAQPSNWVEIEPELPIDVAEPDLEPVDRRWFAVLLAVLVVFWVLIYLGVVA